VVTGIVMGEGFDPFSNLALEQALVSAIAADEAVLYLWQNRRTVVIGRHQDARAECHLDALDADGGTLARRLSGGGAVYHDLGNLNFTFIVPKAAYDLSRQLRVILGAVRSLGVEAAFSGRNDILAQGRKFSGNAFYHGKDASFHHGTLLVDGDMADLMRYLNVPQQKMASKGVASVRSRVVNLREIAPALTVDALKGAMARAFYAEYGPGGVFDTRARIDDQALMALVEKYRSDAWRFHKNPGFDAEIETRFPWGGVRLCLSVRQDRIQEAVVYSDAMDERFIRALMQALRGVPYRRGALADAVKGLQADDGAACAADVAQWFSTAALPS
jgi:lipoate-protein ligase A